MFLQRIEEESDIPQMGQQPGYDGYNKTVKKPAAGMDMNPEELQFFYQL